MFEQHREDILPYIYMEECLPDVVQTSTLPFNEGDIFHHAKPCL